MIQLGSAQSKTARRELEAANRKLDAALRGRDWSARALREAAARIRNDAVISMFGRVVLHHDRVATPSGTFPLCKEITADVEASQALGRAVLAISAPSGRHLEPCRAGEHFKAQVFASRVTSTARTLAFEIEPADRLRDLAARYELLDAPDSPARRALAELRELETRLRAEGRLSRRYRPRPDPPRPPELPL